MPPKKGGKSARGPKLKRQSTQFGKLDTTPTSRHSQSPDKSQSQKPTPTGGEDPSGLVLSATKISNARSAQVSQNIDEFENDIEDVDLIGLVNPNQAQSQPLNENGFIWSEAGSNTRRSSPVLAGETPRDVWDFDQYSLEQLSSPKSGHDQLPETVPIPQNLLKEPSEDSNDVVRRVDFSETASTLRRSSPYLRDARDSEWSFDEHIRIETIFDAQNPIEASSEMANQHPRSPVAHYPMEELYQATPPKPKAQRPPSPSPQERRSSDEVAQAFPDPTPPQTSIKSQKKNKHTERKKKPMYQLLKDDLQSQKGEEPLPTLGEGMESPQQTRDEIISQSNKAQDRPMNSSVLAENEGKQPTIRIDAKGKKRKQRAKAPIEFDEETQQMKETSLTKKPTAPLRKPLLTALQNAARLSGSPASTEKKKRVPKKVAAKSTPKIAVKAPVEDSKDVLDIEPPKKKQKTAAQKVQQSPLVAAPTRSKRANKTTSKSRVPAAVSKTKEKSQTAQAAHMSPEPIIVSSDHGESSPLSDKNSSLTQHPLPEEVAVIVKHGDVPQVEPNFSTQEPFTTLPPIQGLQGAPEIPSEQNILSLQEDSDQEMSDELDLNHLSEYTKSPTSINKPKHSSRVVLKAQDPTTIVKQTLPASINSNQSKREVQKVQPGSSRPIRKTRNISRSFSISEVGSPVPTEKVPASPDHPQQWDIERPDLAERLSVRRQPARRGKSQRNRPSGD